MKISLLSLITLACLSSLQAQGPLRPQVHEQEQKRRRQLIAEPGMDGAQAINNTSSLLKVNVTYQSYNLQIPWQKETSSGRRGLGVVLPNNRVLVTAQMVADATYIELELPDSGQKITAKVQAVDYEANLAVLAPNSPAKEKAFFFHPQRHGSGYHRTHWRCPFSLANRPRG